MSMKQEYGQQKISTWSWSSDGYNSLVYLKFEQGIDRKLYLVQGNRREPETGAGMNVHLRLEQEWILDNYLNLEQGWIGTGIYMNKHLKLEQGWAST